MRYAAFLIGSALLLTSLATAAERRTLQTRDYRLSVSPRTPDQIGAFYEARGFPRETIQILRQQCYLTVYFHNTSPATIWVELSNWRFTTADGEVKRQDRAYWLRYWKQHGLPQRYISTFRWTLIPESLDYRPDEREGGNLILTYTDSPIRLEAQLRIVDGNRERIEPIRLEGIECKR